ncbi:MAG: iron-sulfur cluster insertion protein ErpA [Kiloniellales bacterium]
MAQQGLTGEASGGGGPAVSLTEGAIRRIAFLKGQEGNDALMLRVTVSGGGCSGFQYGFSFDDAITGDDRVFGSNEARVVIDDLSLDLLNGAEIDFVEDLMGAYFKINNPNATSSCGCGSSFSI